MNTLFIDERVWFPYNGNLFVIYHILLRFFVLTSRAPPHIYRGVQYTVCSGIVFGLATFSELNIQNYRREYRETGTYRNSRNRIRRKREKGSSGLFVGKIIFPSTRPEYYFQSDLIALYAYCLHRYRLIGRQLHFSDYYL